MVGTVLGLPCEVENHASYIQSWLGVLREDKRAVFRAAAAAQKAADWMLALHPEYAQAAAGVEAGADAGAGDVGDEGAPASPGSTTVEVA